MRKPRKKEGELQTAGVFLFALMYMENTICLVAVGVLHLNVIVKVGIGFCLNTQHCRTPARKQR